MVNRLNVVVNVVRFSPCMSNQFIKEDFGFMKTFNLTSQVKRLRQTNTTNHESTQLMNEYNDALIQKHRSPNLVIKSLTQTIISRSRAVRPTASDT